MDNELVAPENRRVIGKCNMRINTGMKPKECTYQVVLDALDLTTCYPAFLITAEVLVVLGKEFDEPPTKDEALSFIRELGHSREIRYITNVVVGHLHQPWRTFASIINKCLCGKVSGLDKIRLLRIQILWGMYYKKNQDFVALIWEDLAYQIDNIDSKKQDKMFYPRFTKIIIHHFLTKDKSISMRNRMFIHTPTDDSLLGTMRFVSRHADTQVYGAILPEAMTNQALQNFVAYKTYYAIASGSEPPQTKKSQKKPESSISSEESPSKKKPAKAKKDAVTKPKPSKKKAPVKADAGKGLNVLSEVALSEAAQLKEATKQSQKEFHASHASGSGVPELPKYDSKSDKELWGNSDEEDDDDDETDSDNELINNDVKMDNCMGRWIMMVMMIMMTVMMITRMMMMIKLTVKELKEEEEDSERVHTPPKFVSTHDEEKMDEEEEADAEELYKDLNLNLRTEDAEMTDADRGGSEQPNVSQKSGFGQIEEDAYVTLTVVHDKQKTDGTMQSSFVSSDFTSKLPNLDNTPPPENVIASLMDTAITVPVTTSPKVTSATTVPPPPSSFNLLQQQATPTPTSTTPEATTSFPALPDFSSMFKFNNRVTNLEKTLSEMKQVDQYAQALSSIPAIVDSYIGNQIQEAIQKAIHSHNAECREEALADKEYIDLIDTSVRTIISEEVKTQLPQILPQAVSDFATPVIEKLSQNH
ncbi:hypothetical protein Tco_0799066 [Tanacetum coccineum]